MMVWTLGDFYHLLYERALRCGYIVRISSIPQVGPPWGIWFSVTSEDDVREHPDASLRKDFKNFPLTIDGVKAALEWLDR